MAANRGSLAMVFSLVAAIGAGAAWHWSGPVEPAVRNRWRSTTDLGGGMTREDIMDVARSGEVLLETRWRSTGEFETFESYWRIVTSDGTVHAGTWVQPAPGRVRFAGGFPFEIDTWEREVLPQGGGPLAGRWRDAGTDGDAGVAAFVVDPDGNYRFTRAVEHRAALTARAGDWRLVFPEGDPQTGTYRLERDEILVLSIDGQDVRWEQD